MAGGTQYELLGLKAKLTYLPSQDLANLVEHWTCNLKVRGWSFTVSGNQVNIDPRQSVNCQTCVNGHLY